MSRNQLMVGRRVRSGFSLVEMLLVIAVIAVMISLLLPALSGARDAGLKVSTQSIMADLTSAAQRFSNDHAGRSPGYFSEAEMGHAQNATVGMSAAENAMIELGGTSALLGSEDDPDVSSLIDINKGIIAIGPKTDTTETPRAVVNINLIGAEGAYFTPQAKFFIAQEHGAPGNQQAGTHPGTGQALMPDLLDAWGNPLLIWSQDQSARGSILAMSDSDDVYTQFVRVSSDGAGGPGDLSGPAWFYLNSNAAFLEATGFGPAGINMAGDPTTGRASVIGGGVDDTDRLYTLATMLASPGSYQLDPSATDLSTSTFEQVYPTQPRGRFIVQSAGIDGVFMGGKDTGWAANAETAGGSYRLNFGKNYFTTNGDRLTDDNGSFTNNDMMQDFDDLLVGSK